MAVCEQMPWSSNVGTESVLKILANAGRLFRPGIQRDPNGPKDVDTDSIKMQGNCLLEVFSTREGSEWTSKKRHGNGLFMLVGPRPMRWTAGPGSS